MRLRFLIHGHDEAEATVAPGERQAIVRAHVAYADMLRDHGAHASGKRPAGHDDRAPGEPPIVTDGPFADTKEGIGGFDVVDCAKPRRGDRPGRPRAAKPRGGSQVLGIADRVRACCAALPPHHEVRTLPRYAGGDERRRARNWPARRKSPLTPFGSTNISRMRTTP